MEKNFLSVLPTKIEKSVKVWNGFFLFAVLLLLLSWFFALFCIGQDLDQGQIYRIMFVHVPVAWCAFFWIFMGAIFALFVLFKNENKHVFDMSSQTAMELGALFSFLVLMTGSIWGRPTWGVWWDWDPRLTSSLVMFIVSCAYLILRRSYSNSLIKQKSSALMAVLCSVNVPIVYYSVNLWRSLHQPQTFVQKANNASSDITAVLFVNLMTLFFLSLVLYKLRRQSLSAVVLLEQCRLEQGD